MKQTTTYSKKFTSVKQLDNGYFVQECLLTNEGAKKVYERTHNENPDDNLSNDGIIAKLIPYDTVKKTNEVNKEYVIDESHYFKKHI